MTLRQMHIMMCHPLLCTAKDLPPPLTCISAPSASLTPHPPQVAIKTLGCAKLCAEGYEDGLVTHLVIGAERRTIKVCECFSFVGAQQR